MRPTDVVIAKADANPYHRSFEVVNPGSIPLTLSYSGYRWVMKGETYRLMVKGMTIEDGYPLVNQLVYTTDGVVEMIVDTFRQEKGKKDNKELYRQAHRLVKDPGYQRYIGKYQSFPDHLPVNEYTWLCHEADLQHRRIASSITTLSGTPLVTFLSSWYKRHNLRLLYNYGITKKEVSHLGLPVLGIYRRLTHYPYAIPLISYEQAGRIIEMCGLFKPLTNREWHEQWGLLLRELHRLTQQGYYRVHQDKLARFNQLFSEPGYSMFSPLYLITKVDEYLYLDEYHRREEKFIERIIRFVKQPPPPDLIPSEEMNQRLADHHYDCYDSSSEDQQLAIKGALYDRVSIISGGAGTGKSRCLLSIITILVSMGRRPLVVTPTGIASVRLRKESGAVMVSTIHSAIRYRELPPKSSGSALPPMGSSRSLPPPEEDPSAYYLQKFDHLIVDEMGMVSLELLHRLLRTYPELQYFTMVGDRNQLQPIKAAPLFSSLIESQVIPHYHLYINHRTKLEDDSENYIATNAERILYDFMPLLRAPNFQFIDGTIDAIVEVQRVAREMEIPCRDLIVLSPYNEPLIDVNHRLRMLWNGDNVVPPTVPPLLQTFLGVTGAMINPESQFSHINALWDEVLPHLPSTLTDSWNNHWALGDRVKMKVNNRIADIYNGDEGFITGWGWNIVNNRVALGCMVTIRDDHTIFFSFSSPLFDKTRTTDNDDPEQKDLYNNECITYHLRHNYGSTIHSCQGAEYPYVIIYLPPGTTPTGGFLNRQMLYTMVTRAKQSCWIAGESEMVNTISAFIDHSDRIHTGTLLRSHLPLLSTGDELAGIEF